MTPVRQMAWEVTLWMILLSTRERYMPLAFLAGVIAATVTIYIYRNGWIKKKKKERRT